MVFIALGALASRDVHAYTFQGGEPLSPGNKGLRIAVGFPEVEAAWVMGQTSQFDMAPKVGFFYGYGLSTGRAGMKAGCDFRYRLMKRDHFNLSFFADPTLMFGSKDTFILSSGLPGVRADYEVAPGTRIIGGLQLPIQFVHTDAFQIYIPVLLDAGMEAKMNDQLSLFVDVVFGPTMNTKGSDTFLNLRAMVGLGWKI